MDRRMRLIALGAFALAMLGLVLYSLRAQDAGTYSSMGSIPQKVEKHREILLELVNLEQRRLADHSVWVTSRPAGAQIQLDSGGFILREDWLAEADAAKAVWDQAEVDLQP